MLYIMSCPFHKFKDALGVPGNGIHKMRLIDVALFDYVFTIILSIFFSYISNFPLLLSTILWFCLAIFFHAIFGVNTSVVNYFNLTCNK